MGWSGTRLFDASKEEIKREITRDYNWENEKKKVEVVKSKLVGGMKNGEAYLAIKITDKENNTETISANVVLYSYENNELLTKGISEEAGPCYYRCPKEILNMLSPTENEYAKKWREECLNRYKKDKNKYSLSNLPENSIIETTFGETWSKAVRGQTLRVKRKTISKSFFKKGQLTWVIESLNAGINRTAVKGIKEYKIIQIGNEILNQPIEIKEVA